MRLYPGIIKVKRYNPYTGHRRSRNLYRWESALVGALTDVSAEELAALGRKHHIRRLALFGSALRRDFDERSDLDILVEFEPGHTPGLDFFAIEQELSQLFGRKVNLNTAGFLSSYFRNQVLAEAVDLYVAPSRFHSDRLK